MDKEKEIEDRHEIASIINGCLRDGYCTASHLARRITQAGYSNVKQAVKEFAEKLKRRYPPLTFGYQSTDIRNDINELIKELYSNDTV